MMIIRKQTFYVEKKYNKDQQNEKRKEELKNIPALREKITQEYEQKLRSLNERENDLISQIKNYK